MVDERKIMRLAHYMDILISIGIAVIIIAIIIGAIGGWIYLLSPVK